MAENLKKTLNIDGTDYNINAVYSDEAGKVTNPLIVKRSGDAAFNFNGSTSGQTIDYVPTEGGTFHGKVYIEHANVLDKDLTTVTDAELMTRDQISHLVSAVTQHPLYSWENKQLEHLKNVQGGLSGLNVVVGTTDEFNTFKRVMGVPKLSYETSSSELYYGLSLNNNGTGKCLVGSYNKNSTYTDVFIPSVGYPSFDSATKTIYLADKRTLTCIGAKAFEGNTKITKVSIPDSVTEIKNNAFDGCTALKSIILPSKLAYISGFTFRNCSSLESIVIGANVTADNVESSAFNGCTSLNKVYYAGTEDAWNAIIAKIKEDYPSNDGTARLETITNNKNVVFNYQYAPDFIDLPCLYICTDLGTNGLNIDNVNKMFLKMPNSGLFVELSRGATYLESTLASSKESYTYEGLAEIIARINTRLDGLGIGVTATALPTAPLLNVGQVNALVPEIEITEEFDPEAIPTIQDVDARLNSIEDELGINDEGNDTRLDAIEDGETRVVKEARKVSNGLTINVEDDTFVYDGSSAEEVTIKTTYTNDTPIVTPIGSIVEGQTFKDVPVQEMLTMILYPYVDIDVSFASASAAAKGYYVHQIPTLNSVTFNVKKNSVTVVQFVLWDVTNNQEIATLSANDVADNKLIFKDLNITVDTTRTFALKYTYVDKNISSTTNVTKTCTVGEFKLSFLLPADPTITSSLGDNRSYYTGQTATLSTVTVSHSGLGSTAATGGITKLELLRNGSRYKTSEANPSFPYTFTINDSLSSSCSYTARIYYNYRSGDSTITSESFSQSDAMNFTFTVQGPTIAISGITSKTKSKLEPQTINANAISAKVTKNSSKVTDVSLSISGSTVATDTTTANALTKLKADGYDSTQYTVKFNHSKITTCSDTTVTATAKHNVGADKTSSATLSFYDPYCYGFVDTNTTFASVDRMTLAGLPDTNKKSSEQTSITLSAPGSLKKFIYAVPNGTFKSAKDSSNEENFGLFEKNASGGTTKTITWEDGTTTTYQILILKNPSAAAVNLKFSK